MNSDQSLFSFLVAAVLIAMLPSIPVQAQNGEMSASDKGVNQTLFETMAYRYVGPSRGGRVTTVSGHRDEPFTFYMGATGGGVWKTTDYGASWSNISDGYFETGSIGSIDVADLRFRMFFM